MKKALLYTIICFGLSYGFYELTIFYYPNLVYYGFYQKVAEMNPDLENTFRILTAPDEDSRLVVKPNPDFAYASAFYNISEHPIRIKGIMPNETYWSVALYQPNTINYFVRNDQEFDSSEFDLIISNNQNLQYENNIYSSEIIHSPGSKGFILIRLLLKERSEVLEQEMLSFLTSISIEAI